MSQRHRQCVSWPSASLSSVISHPASASSSAAAAAAAAAGLYDTHRLNHRYTSTALPGHVYSPSCLPHQQSVIVHNDVMSASAAVPNPSADMGPWTSSFGAADKCIEYHPAEQQVRAGFTHQNSSWSDTYGASTTTAAYRLANTHMSVQGGRMSSLQCPVVRDPCVACAYIRLNARYEPYKPRRYYKHKTTRLSYY